MKIKILFAVGVIVIGFLTGCGQEDKSQEQLQKEARKRMQEANKIDKEFTSAWNGNKVEEKK